MNYEKLKIIYKIFFKRYYIIIIDSKNPPVEGDTITIENLTATFKKC